MEGEEVFCLEPNRVVDPLQDYFNSGRGFMGGGLFSEQDPNRNPLNIDLELNEWESLPPGSYRLSIVGNRLSPGKPFNLSRSVDGDIALRSNAVEFQVVPADPDWQASQLSSATMILDSPNASEDEKKHAARVLRFLGSEASTRELARRYSSSDSQFGWDFKFGLYGSPHRALAIQAMKAELADPQHPVTNDYVSNLVTLEMQSDPKLRLPAYDPNDKEAWSRARDAHDAEFERRVKEYLQQATTTGKDPAAQAATASEILQLDVPLSPTAKAGWRQVLLSNWATLSVQKQNELIEYRWADVDGGPEWLPVLEQIVAGPASHVRALNEPNREEALLRIYQIAPEQGRHLMMEEIAHPHGDIGIGVLRQLSERELPQFERAWLAKIHQGGAADVVFQLVDRYASARALPEVTSIYESQPGGWACIPQTAMLRYFLRVNTDNGLKQLSAALARRSNTGCYRTQLGELKDYVRTPKLEKLAIAALDDREPAVARDAAVALGKYGSPAAESALWARLEKFHQQWKDKPDSMLHPQPNAIVYADASGLEQALVQAISQAQAWFADGAALRRLKELSTPAMQAELDRALEALEAGEFALDLSWWPEDEPRFTIGWYSGKGMASFEDKLAQFPSGSHFRLITSNAQREAHQAEFAEVEKSASANGQAITILAPR